MFRLRWVALVFAVVGLVAGACGSATRKAAGDRLMVDSTVAPITDIVRQVVGDRVQLVGLIPEGVDSHTFEPSPATVKSLSKADVLFLDGLHLEGSTLKEARANMATGSKIVRLGDETLAPPDYAFDFSFPREKGDPNPHLWMDPVYTKRWSEIIRDTMSGRDPRNASYYRDNQARFAAALDRLDGAVHAAIDSIPPANKKLLTYHDSYAYFSRQYGIEVIAAIQPSDFHEPSPQEVARIVEQVKATHVPAIFGSEVFPSPVLEQIARETGAQFVDKLRDDELPGDPSAANHTYVGLMVEDVQLMTQALGGNPASLAAVPVPKTWLP